MDVRIYSSRYSKVSFIFVYTYAVGGQGCCLNITPSQLRREKWSRNCSMKNFNRKFVVSILYIKT